MNAPAKAGGQTITEHGQQYFEINNVRIKITEHFPASGKPIDELLIDLIAYDTEKKVNKTY